jgi:hypothetical protein
MAFNSNIVIIDNQSLVKQTINKPPISTKSNELELLELEFLLKTLGNVDLKGYQVEIFYTLVIKLQNQFTLKNQ